MKNELQQPYPERKPDLELFTLDELYSWQPTNLRLEHAQKLREWGVVSKWVIEMCQLEQRDRLVGIDDPTEDFLAFHDDTDGVSDEAIAEMITFHQHRILTYMAHLAVVT